uniref:HMMR_C domain-containing protein n=1 Tax=Steinernema glaseri TaxID=37863 RepID=A0A1I8ABT6_9BILA
KAFSAREKKMKDGFSAERAALQSECAALHSKLGKVTDSNNQLASVIEELRNDLKAKEDEFQKERVQLIEQCDGYVGELAKLSSHSNPAQKIKVLEKLRHQITQHEATIADLRAQLASAKSAARIAARNK